MSTIITPETPPGKSIEQQLDEVYNIGVGNAERVVDTFLETWAASEMKVVSPERYEAVISALQRLKESLSLIKKPIPQTQTENKE